MVGVRVRPGMIRDAIVTYLRGVEEASVSEIQTAVAMTLGRTIAPSSVRSYLTLNHPALFTRTKRGHYRLTRR